MLLYDHGRVVCRFGWTPAYTRCRIDTNDSPDDDEHLVARTMYRIGINKYKRNNCASSCLFTKIEIFAALLLAVPFTTVPLSTLADVTVTSVLSVRHTTMQCSSSLFTAH